MRVTRAAEHFHAALEKSRIALRVLAEFAAVHALEVFGVLLVGQAVSRNMVGLESDCLPQALLPLRDSLAGDAVDKIEVQVAVAGRTKDGEGLAHLLRIVHAPQQTQQLGIPRLHPHADAVDAVPGEKVCLARSHSGGIHLHGEFRGLRKINISGQSGKKTVQL